MSRFVRLVNGLLGPRGRFWLSWCVVAVALLIALMTSWRWADNYERSDNNWGHASIDFAGQWVMARLMATGQGQHLYHRNHVRQALIDGLPRENEPPDQKTSDVEDLMISIMGEDPAKAPEAAASLAVPLAASDPLSLAALLAAGQQTWTEEHLTPLAECQLGGPLYPPVHPLLYAPLGLLEPQPAYRVMQLFNLALVLLAGWLVNRLSHGRLSWPVITVALMVFPGYMAALNLGQNPVLTLVLLLGGWLLMSRDRPWLGGVVWGFLAFKPVWGLAFGPVLVLTGRWRSAVAMVTTGAALAGLTLPLVGLQAWFEWLSVGKLGSERYGYDENWIFLGRDLLNLPKRLLPFERFMAVGYDSPRVVWLCRALWLTPIVVTTVVALVWRKRVGGTAGVGPAFLLLGGWLSCFHFMYYDCLLAVLPLAVLFTNPAAWFRPRFWPASRTPTSPELLAYYTPTLAPPPPVPLLPKGAGWPWVAASLPMTVVVAFSVAAHLSPVVDTSWHFPPFETLGLLVIWLWCGLRIVCGKADMAG